MVYVFGHISGAHVNPAVTFGLALNGTVKWGQAVFYWLAQFAGGAAAAAAVHYTVTPVGGSINPGATVGVLTNSSQPILAMGVEIVLTFFLVNTILHTAVGGRGGNMAGWAIGTTLAFAILAGGVLTGASLNPARTFGPAIFTEPSFSDPYAYIIYLFGPLVGATLAVLAYNFLNQPEIEGEDDEEEMEIVYAEKKQPAAKKTTRKPAVRKTEKK
jgi:glycerol uptake facilitator-like aquaporin